MKKYKQLRIIKQVATICFYWFATIGLIVIMLPLFASVVFIINEYLKKGL